MKRSIALLVLISALLFVIPTGEALADGTETLGPPSVTIASGSGIVAAGVGLNSQPGTTGTININVPGTVQQALLYWSCESRSDGGGDQTIKVDGTSVMGSSIGGNTKLDGLDGLDLWTESFRAEITSMVSTGDNSLEISELDCGDNDHGAGLLVIYDDGSGVSDIQIRDGNDFAFCGFSGNLGVTTPQTFTFAAESTDRIADLIMFFGSVGEDRPNSIEITVNGTTQKLSDELNSSDGSQWDTLIRTVNIPAGATSITVEVFSRDDINSGCGPDSLPASPASLVWSAAGLSVLPPEGCTPGYWKQDQHFDSWVDYLPEDDFDDEEVFGCPITIKWSDKGKPGNVSDPTLLQALQAKGGGESALARHAVAALLNAANPDVNYPRNEDQVITMVCSALSGGDIEGTKNTLAGWNEEFCPFDLDDEKPPKVKHTNTNNGPLRSYEITCQDQESGLAEITVTESRNVEVDIPPFTVGTNDPIIVTATDENQSEESFVELEVIDVAGNVTYYDPEDNPASEEQINSGGGGGGGCFIATAAYR